MTLVTLLDYLIDEKLKCNLVIGDHIVMNETAVNSYEMNRDCCWICTNQGHKVKVDLSKFKKVSFDDVLYEPTTPLKMEQYLYKLKENKPFNAYLETSNDAFIAGLYEIGKE